jgi:enoyl-CoA hydratase
MGDLRLEIADGVATVTLDAPPVNVIKLTTYQEIADTFDKLSGDATVNCVIFTAAGTRAFCAGLDLKEFLASTVEEDPVRAKIVRTAFKAVRHCAVPVIAAVNGPAIGAGAVLAAVSDIRLASENATFAMPEIKVGRCGGGAHMGRLISPGMLRLMYFTGEAIDAQEAYRIGLVERVVAHAELMPAAMALARTIAGKSPIGLRTAKRALNEAEFLPVDDGYELEQSYSTQLMATADAREAVRAIVEKRPPVFVGR